MIGKQQIHHPLCYAASLVIVANSRDCVILEDFHDWSLMFGVMPPSSLTFHPFIDASRLPH